LFVGSRRPHLFLLKSLDLVSKIGDRQKGGGATATFFLFYFYICFASKKLK